MHEDREKSMNISYHTDCIFLYNVEFIYPQKTKFILMLLSAALYRQFRKNPSSMVYKDVQAFFTQ